MYKMCSQLSPFSFLMYWYIDDIIIYWYIIMYLYIIMCDILFFLVREIQRTQIIILQK